MSAELSTGPVDNTLEMVGSSAHPVGMSLVDGCPNCVINTEPPTSAAAACEGWACTYRCADCGHAWTTNWRD